MSILGPTKTPGYVTISGCKALLKEFLSTCYMYGNRLWDKMESDLSCEKGYDPLMLSSILVHVNITG
jgi:hypothetical protein